MKILKEIVGPSKVLSIVFLTCLIFFGCDEMKLQISEPTNVLEKPYPLDYPSTNPIPNKIIAVLKKGTQAEIIDEGYEKDFKFYEVRLDDDRKGFIIANSSIKIIQ